MKLSYTRGAGIIRTKFVYQIYLLPLIGQAPVRSLEVKPELRAAPTPCPHTTQRGRVSTHLYMFIPSGPTQPVTGDRLDQIVEPTQYRSQRTNRSVPTLVILMHLLPNQKYSQLLLHIPHSTPTQTFQKNVFLFYPSISSLANQSNVNAT